MRGLRAKARVRGLFMDLPVKARRPAQIGKDPGLKRNKRYLSRPDWADDVKEAVNYFIDACGGDPDAYAVFDFDNTVTVFDIEDQMLEYQIENMAFAVGPDSLKRVMLSGAKGCGEYFAAAACDAAAAYSILWDRYGGFTAAGLDRVRREAVMQDRIWLEFNVKMIEMFRIAYRELSAEAADRWMLHRFCGMTPEEIYGLALKTAKQNSAVETFSRKLESPKELKSEAGPVSAEWIYGISVTENMRELTEALTENGVDVWICSASDVDAVRAGVDFFGLHDSVRGVLGMTPALDPDGRCTEEYDCMGYGYRSLPDGGWKKTKRPVMAVTCEAGKADAIRNVIAPEYGGQGPAACFMDSGGDFAFCTSFDSIRLVVCINRSDRRADDGGSIIARAALFQKIRKVPGKIGTRYVLQGRNEQGMRSFLNSDRTLLFGKEEAVLFTDKDNCAELERALRCADSVSEILQAAKTL